MFIGAVLLVTLAQSTATTTPASNCAQALADALTDRTAAEICAGENAARLANAAPKDSQEKARQLAAAAQHYRKAASLASKVDLKVLALNAIVDLYDAQHPNDPREMEAALREHIQLTPNDLAPVF